jgi:hypothetical protein
LRRDLIASHVSTSTSRMLALSAGRGARAPVKDVYTAPCPFAGILHRVVDDVAGEPVTDHEAMIRIALGFQ